MGESRSPDGAGRSDRLGPFLRDRRSKVFLNQTGLPGRRGGRAATLTQEDLARLTGYSIRTISALEQGTDHRPTPDLLEAIAAALRLSTAERHTLWYLAANTPPPEAGYVSDLSVEVKRMWDSSTEVYLHPPSVVRVFRPPGHTDPRQADDRLYHVPVTMCVLSPTKPDDERRLVTYLLPVDYPPVPGMISDEACTACGSTSPAGAEPADQPPAA